MTDIDARFYADRLEWVFRRSGENGKHTRLFRDLPEEVQAHLISAANVSNEELPVLGCFFDHNAWVLLTTRRLIWKRGIRVESIETVDIHDATIEPDALFRARNKRELRELTIVKNDGTRFNIEVEPGRPFSGFWNTLKAIPRSKRE